RSARPDRAARLRPRGRRRGRSRRRPRERRPVPRWLAAPPRAARPRSGSDSGERSCAYSCPQGYGLPECRSTPPTGGPRACFRVERSGSAAGDALDVVEVPDAPIVVTHHEVGATVLEHESPGGRTDLVDGAAFEVVHV